MTIGGSNPGSTSILAVASILTPRGSCLVPALLGVALTSADSFVSGTSSWPVAGATPTDPATATAAISPKVLCALMALLSRPSC